MVPACAGGLAQAEAAFKEGRYPDAKARLVGLEGEAATWSPSRRAEYALYRGLTHGALGDEPLAEAWLRRAEELQKAEQTKNGGGPSARGALSEDDAVRLQLGLEGLPRR